MANRIVNLDANAGVSMSDLAREAVIRAMDRQANPSSIHGPGRTAHGELEVARESLACVFDCSNDQIVFTSGATEAAALALSPCILDGETGRNIGKLYVSAVEHPCVYSGGRLAERVEFVPVRSDGVVDLAALERMLGAHDYSAGVPFLALMLANNETGVVQPVPEASRLVKDYGGYAFCDAVQAVGRIPFTFDALGTDFVSVSSHKIGGPHGAGALLLASADIRPLPLLTGGGQERGLRAGTENVAAIAGFGVAAKEALHHLENSPSTEALRDSLEVEITALTPDAVFAGGAAERLPNTSMVVVPGLPAETAVIAFDLEGFAVSSGSACSSGKVSASHVLLAMGYSTERAGNGIRISLPFDTTEGDIEEFLKVWRSVVDRLRPDKAA